MSYLRRSVSALRLAAVFAALSLGLGSVSAFSCPTDARVSTLAQAEAPTPYIGAGVLMGGGSLNLQVPDGATAVTASVQRENFAQCQVTEITPGANGTTSVCISFKPVAVEDQWNECYVLVDNGQAHLVRLYFVMK